MAVPKKQKRKNYKDIYKEETVFQDNNMLSK